MRTVRDAFSVIEDAGLSSDYIDPKTGEVRRKKGKTRQSEKDSCDINLILARYQKTGMLPEMIKADPRYGDFSAVPDFLEAQEIVAKATEQFEALDAAVRYRFENDPAKMLAFVADPKNGAELVKLGLAVKKEKATEVVAAALGGAAAQTPAG